MRKITANHSLRFALIYITFSFDFLGFDKVYFENNFVNQLTRIKAFKPIKMLPVRVLTDLKISPLARVFKP